MRRRLRIRSRCRRDLAAPCGRDPHRGRRHLVASGVRGAAQETIAPVAASYVTAFSLLTVALANGMPVGISYGIWAASGVALTAIGARVFFKEQLTWRMVAGIVLIAIGVFIIELGAPNL